MHKGVVIVLFVLLLLSLAVNFMLLQQLQQKHSRKTALREKYSLMSPRAVSPNSSTDYIVNFLPLRGKIHKQVDPYANSVAVYFDYLPTGTTIGINEDKEFTAESLLKVPIIMAYYHKKELEGLTADPTVQLKK